jgi:hypothetical protein
VPRDSAGPLVLTLRGVQLPAGYDSCHAMFAAAAAYEHSSTGFDKGALGIGRGNPMMRRERRKLDGPADEERVRGNEKGVGPVARERGEGRLDFPTGAGFENLNLQSEDACRFPYLS